MNPRSASRSVSLCFAAGGLALCWAVWNLLPHDHWLPTGRWWTETMEIRPPALQVDASRTTPGDLLVRNGWIGPGWRDDGREAITVPAAVAPESIQAVANRLQTAFDAHPVNLSFDDYWARYHPRLDAEPEGNPSSRYVMLPCVRARYRVEEESSVRTGVWGRKYIVRRLHGHRLGSAFWAATFRRKEEVSR